MVTRDRHLLEQLIKQWAQDHTSDFIIADHNAGDTAMENTQGYLTWVVRESHASLDLLSLVDRLEIFLENKRNRRTPDGMKCQKCQTFYDFAEPNQPDGSLLCYSCRSNPYR
jgi:hypothetical protein